MASIFTSKYSLQEKEAVVRKLTIHIVLLAIILTSSACVQHTETRLSQIGDKLTDLPSSWQDIPVVLIDSKTDLEFEIRSSGNRLIKTRTDWYRVNRRNPNYMENVERYEVNSYEKLVEIKARAYYPDNSSWTLQPQDIRRRKIPLSNLVIHRFDIPGYDPGVLIMVQTRHRIFHPEFTGMFLFGDDHPALSRTIALSYPVEADLKFGIENGQDLTINESTITQNGTHTHKYHSKMVTDRWPRSKSPFPEQYYSALHVSFPPSGSRSYTWQELGNHYLDLSKQAFALSEPIKLLGKQIQNTASGDIVDHAFDTIVKKIRYQGDWDGRYAFFPRDASTILQHGYGDCKEISTILKATLASNHIPSSLALVSTRNYFQPIEAYPHLDGFNHTILAQKLGNAPYRFLDGTWSWAHAGNSYYHLIGRTAFVLEKDRSVLVTIAPDKDFKNEITTRSTIFQNPSDGLWKCHGRIDLVGKPALRFYSQLNWRDTLDNDAFAKTFLLNNLGVDASAITLVELSSQRVMIDYISLFQESYLSLGNGGFKLSVPNLYKQEIHTGLTDKRGPVQLSRFRQTDQWEFSFPASLSEPDTFDMPFARCTWNTETESVKRTYRQNSIVIPSDDFQLKKWNASHKALVKARAWNQEGK